MLHKVRLKVVHCLHITTEVGFRQVGLLPRDNDVQMGFAYKLYQREDEEGLRFCEGFKRTYCQNVQIEFVGVWYASRFAQRLDVSRLMLHTGTRLQGLV